MSKKFSFDHPDDAIRTLADSLSIVSTESDESDCSGRVASIDILADRDSPAANVSAMDGYAIRLKDLQTRDDIPIVGESIPGAPPPVMPEDGVIRIFTGAIVPRDCDAVIKREDTIENASTIRFTEIAMQTQCGDHIRRAGENAKAGSTVVPTGTLLSAAVRATMANFGAYTTEVFARVRVTVITTGDEVVSPDQAIPQPWQLRNSNQVAITSLFSRHAWIDVREPIHCKDDRQHLMQTIDEHLRLSDAIILTGGVSMGDYDYVPEVVQEVGGEIIFHGLPIRPGKPILGATTSAGKLMLGLPGNPVSATLGSRRFGIPLLAKMSGQTNWLPPCPTVRLRNGGDKSIPLFWMRLVRLVGDGVAEAVVSQGSGDLVSLGQSTGFVQIPPSQSGEGPWPYYS